MRIFLDLDGTLVDFYRGVCELNGTRPWPYCCRINDWNFYEGDPLNFTTEQLAPLMDREFYANLRWMADGTEILHYYEQKVGQQNIFLLTSPWETDGCEAGKRDWVRKHCPRYVRRLVIANAKEACSSPDAILVDDSWKNIESFTCPDKTENPGKGVLVPRPWNPYHAECCHDTGRILSTEVLDLLQVGRSKSTTPANTV